MGPTSTKAVFGLRWLLLSFVTIFSYGIISAQSPSVAMQWSEVQLNCIRKDAARPTIQARNLYHAAIVMYDAWAAFDDDATTVFLGKTLGGFTCPFNGIAIPEDRQAAQEKTISYAMYRFLANRYQPFSPTPAGQPANNWITFSQGYCNAKMAQLGYDPSITSTDYSDGDPAKLGNYIALKMQEYGLQDGANQANNYANQYYFPVNGNLFAELPGNPQAYDGNRWQPLSLTTALDQNGLPVPNGQPALSAEWGNVTPFALTQDMSDVYQREGSNWRVYLDQGMPPMLDTTSVVERQWDEDFFRWGFVVVALWHSFHDVSDGVLKDISPNSIGNVDDTAFPETFEEFKDFYNEFQGGDPGTGYTVNPATGQPYPTNIVPRGDYSRVLAEYWADGPNSETPPGHWFKNINAIAQHPLFEKRWEGTGEILNDLEWDVRAYLALGGGIHDAAVACWSTKGYYDYTRPIMAIRYMIDHGQCSDISLPNYDPAGIPLIPGYIEVIEEGDPLAGTNNEHVGKVKLYTFRGPIAATGQDGVGWIRGENWWTFQRRTFVTPPFPGYYSGHSTYSRSAAEILERITGSEYYPGGLGEFVAPQTTYLPHSPGPSVTTTLQWAKYKDAADQCSLSRIYGGLHPPQDDIPGRKVGQIVGPMAYEKAMTFMSGYPHVLSLTPSKSIITDADAGTTVSIVAEFSIAMDLNSTPALEFAQSAQLNGTLSLVSGEWIDATHYEFVYNINDSNIELGEVEAKVISALGSLGNAVFPSYSSLFEIDTQNPVIDEVTASSTLINDNNVDDGLSIAITFDQPADMTSDVSVTLSEQAANNSIVFNAAGSSWINETTYNAVFDVTDENATIGQVDVVVSGVVDPNGNPMLQTTVQNVFAIDTENPDAVSAGVTNEFILVEHIGSIFPVTANFSEAMDQTVAPVIQFNGSNTLSFLSLQSQSWLDADTYLWNYQVTASDEEINDITVTVTDAKDANGNLQSADNFNEVFSADLIAPAVEILTSDATMLADNDTGASSLNIEVVFDDEMNMSIAPEFVFVPDISGSLILNTALSSWSDDYIYNAVFSLSDNNVEISGITLSVVSASDISGNDISQSQTLDDPLAIDTKNPSVIALTPSVASITEDMVGQTFTITVLYDEPMNVTVMPVISFPIEDTEGAISYTSGQWLSNTTFVANYLINDVEVYVQNIDVTIESGRDVNGNLQIGSANANKFSVTLTTAIEEAGEIDAVVIYPNPVTAGRDIIISMKQIPGDLTISILDLSGKVVRTFNSLTVNGDRISVPTAGIAGGNYFITLRTKDAISSYQISIIN